MSEITAVQSGEDGPWAFGKVLGSIFLVPGSSPWNNVLDKRKQPMNFVSFALEPVQYSTANVLPLLNKTSTSGLVRNSNHS